MRDWLVDGYPTLEDEKRLLLSADLVNFVFVDVGRASDLVDNRLGQPPSHLTVKVEQFLDYQQGVGGLPSANVLEFDLEKGNKVIVRPSGTEPKVKVYLFTVGESASEAEGLADVLSSAMAVFMK